MSSIPELSSRQVALYQSAGRCESSSSNSFQVDGNPKSKEDFEKKLDLSFQDFNENDPKVVGLELFNSIKIFYGFIKKIQLSSSPDAGESSQKAGVSAMDASCQLRKNTATFLCKMSINDNYFIDISDNFREINSFSIKDKDLILRGLVRPVVGMKLLCEQVNNNDDYDQEVVDNCRLELSNLFQRFASCAHGIVADAGQAFEKILLHVYPPKIHERHIQHTIKLAEQFCKEFRQLYFPDPVESMEIHDIGWMCQSLMSDLGLVDFYKNHEPDNKYNLIDKKLDSLKQGGVLLIEEFLKNFSSELISRQIADDILLQISNNYDGYVDAGNTDLVKGFLNKFLGLKFNYFLVLNCTEDYAESSVVKHGDVLARLIQDAYESFLKTNNIQCDGRFFSKLIKSELPTKKGLIIVKDSINLWATNKLGGQNNTHVPTLECLAACNGQEAFLQEPDAFREVQLDLLTIMHFTYTAELSYFKDPDNGKKSFSQKLSESKICQQFGIVSLLKEINFSKYTKKEELLAFLQAQAFLGLADDGALKSSGLGQPENFRMQDIAAVLVDVTFDTWLTVGQKKACASSLIEKLPEENKKEFLKLALSNAISSKNDPAIRYWIEVVFNEFTDVVNKDINIFDDFFKKTYTLHPHKFPVNLSGYFAAHGLLESLSFLLGKDHFNSVLDGNKISPLGHAASNGRFEVVDFLLNTNYVEAANEVSPLYWSMKFGLDEISERLIESFIGLKYSKFEYDNKLGRLNNSYSLLDCAYYLGKPKLLALMLEKGYAASKGYSFFSGDCFRNPIKLMEFNFKKNGDLNSYIDMVFAHAKHHKIIPRVFMPVKAVIKQPLGLNEGGAERILQVGTMLAYAVAKGDLDLVQRTLTSITDIYEEQSMQVDEHNFGSGEPSSCSTVVSERSNFEHNKIHETYVSWVSSFKSAWGALKKLLLKATKKVFGIGRTSAHSQQVIAVKNSDANLNPWLQKHLNAQRLIPEPKSSMALCLARCAQKIAPSLCQGPKSWAWIRSVLDKQRFTDSPLMLAFQLGHAEIAKLLLQYEELDGEALIKNVGAYKGLIEKHQSSHQNDPAWDQKWQQLDLALDARVASQNLEAIDSQAS